MMACMQSNIYETPELTSDDLAVLDLIGEQLNRIRPYVRTPRKWFGTLRRGLRASSIRGSNAIEGYVASKEDVAAILDGQETSEDVAAATRQAIEGYQQAMGFVVQLTGPLDLSLLKALHFMLLQHDLKNRPGLWRITDVYVSGESGPPVYTGPDMEVVESLLSAMCDQVKMSEAPRLVTAAMAHLNLVMIHPFRDGNGRMARIVQSLVLLDETLPGGGVPLTPDFGNIEEYLFDHQLDYYSVLSEMSDGTWSPRRSVRPWLEFILTAHYQQAQAIRLRIAETEALWDQCEQLASANGLPDRAVGILNDTARGWSLTRALYIARAEQEKPLSEGMASRDLAALVKAGLLIAVGDKRGRTYLPSDTLSEVWREVQLELRQLAKPNPYKQVRFG